jgi:predicted amidohydrolase
MQFFFIIPLVKTINGINMKVGLVQYSPEWENKENNIIKLNKILEEKLSDEELLIFPEMTLTGFTMESEKYAEEIDGTGMLFFINTAKKYKRNIFAGVIEKDNNKIYNSLIHFDKNGIITARYRKIHPFTMTKEKERYHSGNEIVKTKIENINFGLTVCYDLRFPELYRLYGKEKVDVLVNIANWPVTRIAHWKLLLKSRAVENQCFMIGVNRVGKDPYETYNGFSIIIDPMGNEIIVSDNEESIISTELDFSLVEKTRNKMPFLNDIKLI